MKVDLMEMESISIKNIHFFDLPNFQLSPTRPISAHILTFSIPITQG